MPNPEKKNFYVYFAETATLESRADWIGKFEKAGFEVLTKLPPLQLQPEALAVLAVRGVPGDLEAFCLRNGCRITPMERHFRRSPSAPKP